MMPATHITAAGVTMVMADLCGTAIAQAAPDIGPWAQLGAVGVMGVAFIYLLTVALPKLQANFTDTLDRMTERHDKWEVQRHTDSERFHDAIRALTENCARANAANPRGGK